MAGRRALGFAAMDDPARRCPFPDPPQPGTDQAGQGAADPLGRLRMRPGRCFPRHFAGLPGPDHRQCRDAAQWPFRGRPASVAGRLPPAGQWRWVPLAANSARTGWRSCAAAPRFSPARFSPARDLDVFVEKLLAEPPKWGVREGLPQLKERAESARDAAWGARQHLYCQRRFRAALPMMWRRWPSSQLPLTRDKRLSRAAERMLDRQCRRVKKARQAWHGPAGRGRPAPAAHRAQEAALHLRIFCPALFQEEGGAAI